MNELIECYKELLLIEIERTKRKDAQPEKLNALREGIATLVTLRATGMLPRQSHISD